MTTYLKSVAFSIIVVFTMSVYAQAAVTNVGLWRLGDDDPGALAGNTGNNPTVGTAGGANLTRTGSPTYTSSSSSNAFAANASSLAVDFENDSGSPYYNSATVPTTVQTNFGIEAWVNTEALDAFNFVASNGSSGNQGWGLGQFNGATWGIGHMGSTVPSSNVPIATGKWQHVAIVRDSAVSGGATRLYVDGNLSALTVPGAPIAPSNSFTIGANQLNAGTFEGFFDGAIDDVRVFTFDAGSFDAEADLNVANNARKGTAIMGIHTADDGTRGTDHVNAGAGALTNVNDGDLTTKADNWSGTVDGSAPFDWVGVEWDDEQIGVSSIRLYHATFNDGGWFGNDTAATPAPKVQYTTDGGITWIDATGLSTDYVSVLAGVGPSQGTAILRPAVDFNFDTLNHVTGVRLFGTGGGVAGADAAGFISAFEIMVNGTTPAPEPSSLMLLFAGLLGIAGSRRRRSR